MRILFVADGRSPIALNWIKTVIVQGHEVHLVSTFPCQSLAGVASLQVIPVAGSSLVGERGSNASEGSAQARLRRTLRTWIPVWLRTAMRQRLGQATIPGAIKQLIPIIQRLEPEVVHAMRIPYEGILAAGALSEINGPPLLLSVWGNDFTLHAGSNRYLGRATRRALQRADGLHADCQRDIRLGRAWGYSPGSPAWVLPGGGGIHLDLFRPLTTPGETSELVINPRGMRAYIRNDTFFRAIPLVLANRTQVRFVCPNMAGESLAERWIHSLGVEDQVQLLPPQTSEQMAEWFSQSKVVISPSIHDGTPNTLLEAMACGCFPIAGDLESLREWIVPGVNGLLFEPEDHLTLAAQILLALEQHDLLDRARIYNLQQVQTRADHQTVMEQAEGMYRSLIEM